MTFSGTQKLTPPSVFNLQASDWVHCEEETGAHAEYPDEPLNLYSFLQIFKFVYFAKKIRTFQKISQNLLLLFFHKEIIQHTYIFTKYIDNSNFLYLENPIRRSFF